MSRSKLSRNLPSFRYSKTINLIQLRDAPSAVDYAISAQNSPRNSRACFLACYSDIIRQNSRRPQQHFFLLMRVFLFDNSFFAKGLPRSESNTEDYHIAMKELNRVLKPGGIVFGNQGTLPIDTPYMQLNMRVHEEVTGFFSHESFLEWLKEANIVDYKRTMLAGVFRARKEKL